MNRIKRMTNIAMIAAVYFVLGMALQNLSFNVVQIRVAEALIISAIVSKDGIYGITVGCLITNAIGVALGIGGFGVLDIIFGTLITFIASVLAYGLRNHRITKLKIPFASLMMPVLLNAIGLPIVFAVAYHQAFIFNVYVLEFVSIFIGQFVSCVVIGGVLYTKLEGNLQKYLNH